VPRDIVRVEGIRTTSATRTLIDLGGVVTSTMLGTALERALHARLTTFERLVSRFFEVARQGRTGVGPLRILLVDRDPSLAPAESDLETHLLRMLREAGLPEPTRQFDVVADGERFRLDLAYPELKIFIEGDGFGVHSTRTAFEHDRERQNLLVASGWLPLRFTWRQLCHDPVRVIARVVAARNRRLQEC
jgi:very-short-patch-repair endonuclease